MFRFLLCVWLLGVSLLNAATFSEALDEFNEGNYASARAIFSKFETDIRARLYLLASQEFANIPISEPVKVGLKALIEEALANQRHEDHIAAQIVHAFWHIYSEDATPPIRGHQPAFHSADESPWRQVPRDEPADGARHEDHVALQMEAGVPRSGFEGGDLLGAALGRVDVEDLEVAIHQGEYFPISDLFEGTPSVDAGVRMLQALGAQRDHHAMYFLGNYIYGEDLDHNGLDLDHKREIGLGLIAGAAHLKNATAKALIDQLMGEERQKGWIHNCGMWCCCSGASGTKRFYCGADQHGQWWICSMGLCGCRTRWSMGELCFNVQNLSRQTLGGIGFFFGLGLIITQQLSNSELIDLSDNMEEFLGWMGAFLAAGGYGVSHTKSD